MAFVIIKITTSDSVNQANSVCRDDTHAGLQALENLLNRINSGSKSAQVDVVVSGTDEVITAQNGGKSASYNKL